MPPACCSKALAHLDRDAIAGDLVTNVEGVHEVHHMHLWSIDGTSNVATLHACLKDGADLCGRCPHQDPAGVAARIAHATVEPEFGACADRKDGHDHDHEGQDHSSYDHHHGHDHSAAHAGHKH
jgi:cobalt-zinc-cadmium efflux system protein